MQKKRNKYSNRKIRLKDGSKYDSELEYSRSRFLRNEERIGHIYNLREQVSFELIPQQTEVIPQVSPKTGKPIKPKVSVVEQSLKYIADFTYCIVDPNDPANHSKRLPVLEDTKGFRTTDYKIKKKCLRFLRHLPITEISHPAQAIPEYAEYHQMLISTKFITIDNYGSELITTCL